MKNSAKGSVLSSVMISTLLAGVLVASVASLMNFQRKQALRQQLKLNSANAAEAAIDYAYSFIVNDAEEKGLDLCTYVPASGGSPFEFTFPPSVETYLKNKYALPGAFGGGGTALSYADIKVRVLPRPAGGPTRVYVNPKDPANASNPNRGQWVYQEAIPIIAAVTATQGGIKHTTYVRKDLNYVITNLFQHAIFFQGDLHLHRGFRAMGSVHTNGNLILNAHDGDHAIYNGFVSAGARFYRGSITDSGGKGMDAYGMVEHLTDGTLNPSKFSTGANGGGSGKTTNPLNDGDIPIYIETDASGKHYYRYVEKTFDLRGFGNDEEKWKERATSDFLGHLQDKSHNVPNVNPIGSIGYAQDIKSTSVNEFKNGPYFLIEPMLPRTNPLRTASDSTKTNYRYNLSANASLVLRVEFSAYPVSPSQATDFGRTWADRGIDPNTTADYFPMSTAAGLPQALNPANYIVRAYKKPANLARIDDPGERIPIPFPTDVIGRADYERLENGTFPANYNYVAGNDPQPIDILGTEGGIATNIAATIVAPAGLVSPSRSRTDTTPDRARQEAWHRYRFETYRAFDGTATTYQTSASPYNGNSILPNMATIQHRGTYDDMGRGNRTSVASSPAIAIGNKAVTAQYGLHDSRLGRGVHLLTLDISRLKEIMEEPIANVRAKFGPEAEAFRLSFNNAAHEWNGIIYVEFPTTTTVNTAVTNRAPEATGTTVDSAYRNNLREPGNPATTDLSADGRSYLDSHPFLYATTPEYKHPYRSSSANPVASREDNVVPIAEGLREYPSTVNEQTITNPRYAILGLQVINAKRLPRVNIEKSDANAQNTINYGFTLATNAPIYLVGSWNSDGDYTTGTNVTSTSPEAYATTDNTVLAKNSNPEIPSAIFCDSLTVLSPGWATQTGYPSAPTASTTRRMNSFRGWTDSTNNSLGNRLVTWKNANERIEISACIATGEFPVFEFFTHALEDFSKSNGTPCTPLVVKGAMVGMFASEIQHIKQAYGRYATKDIQVYWQAHGAHCFPSPRLHKFILDGEFPPGTPQALVPTQSNFQILTKGDPLITQAGL